VASAQQTQIEYLGAVERLNNINFTDTTLMLNQPTAGGTALVSLLVLSTNSTNLNNFDVVCFNNLNHRDRIQTSSSQNVGLDSNTANNGILLQYLFSSPATNNFPPYYFYVCGVGTMDLFWRLENTTPFAFDNQVIGSVIPTNTLDFSVLIGRKPFSLVALLIRRAPCIKVACADSLNRNEMISCDDILTTTSTDSSETTFTTEPGTSKLLLYMSSVVFCNVWWSRFYEQFVTDSDKRAHFAQVTKFSLLVYWVRQSFNLQRGKETSFCKNLTMFSDIFNELLVKLQT